MLTIDTVVPYLLQHGLIEPRQIVEDDVQVVDVSRRHHNFKLIGAAGAGYFVKHAQGAEAVRSIAREATLYGWFQSQPATEPFADLLPRCRLYDRERDTLVLDLVRDGKSLFEYQWRHGRLPRAVGAALGVALSALHQPRRVTPSSDDGSPGPSARFLQLHRPGITVLTTASAGSLEVVRIVQQCRELCEALDRLNAEWREESLIHGDLRCDNCQIVERAEGRPRLRVQFVDWEMAGRGDPSWDVGTVLSDCLSAWLLSAPITRDTSPHEFLQLARYPMAKMQPGIRSFWQAYTRGMGLEGSARLRVLEQSMRYAAARLVQTAYEEMQGTVRLTASVVYMLQLSVNIMERPLQAASLLLGLSAEGAT
jgi:hypothetical protein